jgi:hypothetical protein
MEADLNTDSEGLLKFVYRYINCAQVESEQALIYFEVEINS